MMFPQLTIIKIWMTIVLWESFSFTGTSAKLDKPLYCSVCRALINEIHWEISLVDPKKTIQVGSFRVDSHGDQAIYEVPYARSETHLTELLENICDQMKNYAETTDREGRKSIVRMSSRNNKAVHLGNISLSGNIQKVLKFACESILEDHEEDLITLLKNSQPQNQLIQQICADAAEFCSEADLLVPMPDSSLPVDGDTDDQTDDKDEDKKELLNAEEHPTASDDIDHDGVVDKKLEL